MTKQAQYVARPCKTLDSPALWDWLERYYPELLPRFNIVFNCEVGEHLQGIPSQHPELREHIKKFVKRK